MYGLTQGLIAQAERIATARPPYIDERYFCPVPRSEATPFRNKISFHYYHLIDACPLHLPNWPCDPEFCLDCGCMHLRNQAAKEPVPTMYRLFERKEKGMETAPCSKEAS